MTTVDVPADRLPIIGRERALISRLTKVLHGAARKYHDYGPIWETARGATFEVRMLVDDHPTGWIARVTVEFDRIEQRPDYVKEHGK